MTFVLFIPRHVLRLLLTKIRTFHNDANKTSTSVELLAINILHYGIGIVGFNVPLDTI